MRRCIEGFRLQRRLRLQERGTVHDLAHLLEASARQTAASLDPVTYALVDPDESVRARAQEVFEQELTRR